MTKTALISIAATAILSPALTACSANASPQPSLPSAPAVQQPASILTVAISYNPGPNKPEQNMALDCIALENSTYRGSVQKTCSWLSKNLTNLLDYQTGPVCTEQYGGPETANIVIATDKGNHTLDLSRTNGCYIEQWDQWSPLLLPLQMMPSELTTPMQS